MGAAAIRAAVERAGLKPEQIAGSRQPAACCRPAERPGAGPAGSAGRRGCRRAWRCTTVNKMCGSGMRAAIDRARRTDRGSFEIAIAGGDGKHDECAAPGAHGPRRLSHRPRHDLRPRCWTAWRTPISRTRRAAAAPWAPLRGLRVQVQPSPARRQDAVRHGERAACTAGDRARRLRWEIAPVTVPGRGGRRVIDTR
ncbi:thiolase family protein [Cupriavidus basilensis]